MSAINGIYKHYIIDMSCNNNFVHFPTMQGDGNHVRGFEVELISNGTQYAINKEHTLICIMGTKPDTSQIMNECELTEEGYILVDVTSQMSAVKGRGDYCITLMDKSTNSQLKSFPFYIITTPAPFDISHITSSDEFGALVKAISDSESITKDAANEIKNMKDLESEFSANEEVRKSNENVRISNENNRQDAEANRITDTAVAITNANNAATNADLATQNANNATTAANTATQNANTATQQANTVIEQMKSLIKDDNIVHTSDLGKPGGVATLDNNGTVPASQLPSFVDDVLEGTAQGISVNENTGTQTATGFILVGESDECVPESDKIYIDTNNNVTYRWGGTCYVSIGSSLSLGTTSSTAFPGDRGLALENKVKDLDNDQNNITAANVKFDNTDTPLLGANVQVAIEGLTKTATQTSNGLLSADDKKRIDNYADLQVIDATLLSSNWSGTDIPFTQIISVENLTTYNNCSIELSPNATPIQITAITDACIKSIEYDKSVGLIFKGYGDKPVIDIPISICVGTSMNVVESPIYVDTPNKASSISYDNTLSGIQQDTVQGAIDSIQNVVGSTDISNIGDGTTTGAIASLNTDMAGMTADLAYRDIANDIQLNAGTTGVLLNNACVNRGMVTLVLALPANTRGVVDVSVNPVYAPKVSAYGIYYCVSENADAGKVIYAVINPSGMVRIWFTSALVGAGGVYFCYPLK